jgi:anaerobic ribonucleoside-triphosphate reductase
MTAKPTTTDTASAISTNRSLNPVDPEALVNTFRNDAMNEDVQRIIRREMEIKDLPIMKELESMRIESRNVHLLSTKFETDREQEQSKFIVNTVDAWIDTAQDSLEIVAHASAMGTKNCQDILSFF